MKMSARLIRRAVLGTVAGLSVALVSAGATAGAPEHSVARQWNEELLESIRNDYARPTIHARNLWHVSVAMWDAWAVYDAAADPYITQERHTARDIEAARNEAISYAAYRIIEFRYADSPGADDMTQRINERMALLGYDPANTDVVGDSPAAIGNRCAANVLAFGAADNSNEANDFGNLFYEPVNDPLLPDFPGNPDITDLNRWQPLALEFFIDQSGNIIIGGYPEFLSPEWGIVSAFALTPEDLTVYQRDGFDYWVFHDPGAPPYIGAGEPGDQAYKDGFAMVSIWSSHLDADDGVMWDVSPASIGNAILPEPGEEPDFYSYFEGGDWGIGHDVNPATGKPYEPQIRPRGDYARILAEFWADGPDSETPPGHWFDILNYVSDHPATVKRLNGVGPILDDLEWDVKTYFAMGGAMHDAAVASWGVKGWYDYLRPISAIRAMADRGQSSDPQGPSYHVDGIPLHPGLIEVITADTIMPGERHEHLAGFNDENVGKIAILAWRGHDYIQDPNTDIAGVGWILAENWWPYQRPSFVTPPFAGYVSGHSTYSRAAAELMELLTGDAYFPGGMGEFHCPQNEFLVFEEGPSVDVTLQWATYRDASDQCSLSRIWGGIHPAADDIPGRRMGQVIGPDAWDLSRLYYLGHFSCPADVNGSGVVDIEDLLELLRNWGSDDAVYDVVENGSVDGQDLSELITQWGRCGARP